MLDVHGGPEEGQSVIMILHVSSDASPQPEWCVSEGAGEFGGPWPDLHQHRRPEVDEPAPVQGPGSIRRRGGGAPAEFQDRVWAEYPELPGRRESEVFGPVDLHIVMD